MIRKVKVILMFCGIGLVQAQQDPQYTQYMFNTASINPAYIGSKENFSVAGLHRSQWVGLEGAPTTQTIALNTPVGYYKRIGLGFSAINDVIGITRETYFNIDFSYNIPFDEYGKLSFGLKVVGQLLDVDFQRLSIFDVNETNFQRDINNRFSPNVGAGVYYNNDKFYVGLSVPNFLETTFFDETETVGGNVDASSFLKAERMHYYLITGYVFDINRDIRFKPALLTKMVSGSPLQVDVSANFLVYNKFMAGVAYRWSAAVSAVAGFRVSKAIMLGFAYDRETTALGNTRFNDGSYEFILKYQLPERCCANRRLTPRFF